MKLAHLADLHIGKRVNGYSMIEDQKYILKEILEILVKEKVDGVIIAGDVYDKTVPSLEAVEILDEFLVNLTSMNLKVFIISGNHDSPERLGFGSRIMKDNNLYISSVYNGQIDSIKLEDEFGSLNIYLLPFIKPSHVRRYYKDEEISSYTDAMRLALSKANLDKNSRNILVTHQFVTGGLKSDSEDIVVGGTDNVDGEVFSDFDYVALGHLHSPQKIGRETVRYGGTPLKYSFSEAHHKKGLTIFQMKEKGNIEISVIPLIPMRNMVEITGGYNEITLKSYYDNLNLEDYFHITLTDEEDIYDAMNILRIIYPNLMKLDYDNTRTRSENEILVTDNIEIESPISLFSKFYEMQNGQPMNETQENIMKELVEEIWGDINETN